MQMMKKAIFAALAVTVAAGFWSAPASAGDKDVNPTQVGAALALPYAVGSGDNDALTVETSSLHTYHTITNALNDPIRLHFFAIDGDAGGNWDAPDWDCRVTARETTLIRISRNVQEGQTYFESECSTREAQRSDGGVIAEELNVPEVNKVTAERGILFVAITREDFENDEQGQNLDLGQRFSSDNAIFGDWVMVDSNEGFAFGSNAIAFQGGTEDVVEGKFEFDGYKLSKFPEVLATNFIAPDEDTEALLWLFTLDGRAGSPPLVEINGAFYNDDEDRDSFQYSYECMDVVDLETLDVRFEASELCPFDVANGERCSGHLAFRARDVPWTVLPGEDYGNVDGLRRRPSHGWIIQADTSMDQNRFWARTLNQSTTAHEPASGDEPTFDVGDATGL